MNPAWTFFTVDVELTNQCLVNCAFCPRQAITRPFGQMSRTTMKRLAEQLAGKSSQITFSGMGDPVHHSDWPLAIQLFQQQGLEVGLQVSIASLTQPVIEQLLKTKPNFLHVSLPSLDTSILSQLLPNFSAIELLERSQYLTKVCRPHMQVMLVGVRTQCEGPTFQSHYKNHGQQHQVASLIFPCHRRGQRTWAEHLVVTQPGSNFSAGPCGLFSRHAFVTWQGDILACCHDLTGATRLGNVLTQPLTELANLKETLARRSNPFLLCSSCDEPLKQLPLPNDESKPNSKKARQQIFKQMKKLLG